MKKTTNKGFSLVELIVVIAIMAILVGVAVPVYTAYVDKSKKATDMDLVAGIIRAIETGTYSQAFVNDDSFKMGSLSYPVGFVVLTTEGAQVITSSTEVTSGAEGTCEFVTIENICIETTKTCTGILCSKQYIEISSGSITYCKTHSPEPVIVSKEGQSYVSGRKHTGGQCSEIPGTYPADAKVVTNASSLYLVSADSSKCSYAYANQYGTFGSSNVGAAGEGNPLYDAIVAAYGTDLSALKLTYDGWISDGGIDYATFYTSAVDLMEDLEDLSGLLATVSGIDALGISQKYENGEAVLTGVAGNFASTFSDLDSWMAVWDNDSAMTWDSYGFGISGRENYSAARMAYNNAFASYLAAKGEPESILSVIREFYSQERFNVGLPGLICTDAFTDTESALKKKITNQEDLDRIAGLYQEYLESDAFTENGEVVYNTLITVNETADIAKTYADQNDGSIYDYYNSYVAEMQELYSTAMAVEDGIVIIVSVENGLLTFQVTPSAANPAAD